MGIIYPACIPDHCADHQGVVKYLCLIVGALATCSGCSKAPSNAEAAGAPRINSNRAKPTLVSSAKDREEPLCSRWIAGADARKIISEGGILLDVRTKDEFVGGHLDGAVNLPVDEIPSSLDELPNSSEIVVYCRSGRRARQAAIQLSEAGHTVSEIGTMSQYAPSAPAGCGNRDSSQD